MDERTIYLGKMNLSSNEIHDIYKEREKLNKILNDLLGLLNSGLSYVEERPIPLSEEEQKEGKEVKFEKIEYRLEIENKTANGIEGYVFRTSNLYYNKLRENSLIASAVENTDAIRFYFDVFHEFVGFDTRGRFGYKMFLEAFENLVNKAVKEGKKSYKFELSLYTEGMELDEIKSELTRLRSIEKLEIKIKPPNPDSNDLDQIENDLEETLEKLKEAKASSQIVILESSGEESLNTNSRLVVGHLNAIESIHSSISSKKATSRGYAQVRATTKGGMTYTSGEGKPITTKSDRESFVKNVTSFIARILTQ